ncbi:thiamine transport system permease protein [Williamsia sterculiae]|uniref:Thiamine transport system permease protein n=1 Tax=Williamsia sterculiae TaxID=1344003 RepID=A0A1N7FSA8_9NOCA|nr:thiamine transport system permease protein [Williamsia sterculiae]
MANGDGPLTTAHPGRRAPVLRRHTGLPLLGAVPAVFLAVFFGWPVVALVARAFGSAGGPRGHLGELLDRDDAWSLLGATLGQAAASTVVTVVVAAPIVWLVARVDVPGSRVLMIVVTVPFVLPTVVVGIAFRALLGVGGPLGFLHLDGTLLAILAAHAFLNVAVVVRVVAATWASLDPRAEQAARTSGASPMRAFVTVVAPRLLPALASSAALVFLFCSTSFGVVLVLGDGRVRTLETEIYTQAISYFDLPAAVAVSMLQILVVFAVVLLIRLLVPARPTSRTARAAGRVRPHGRGWLPVIAAGLWAGAVLLGPPVVLVLRSLRPTVGGEWTLVGYRALDVAVNGQTPLQSMRYSLVSACWAALLALVVGLLTALVLTRSPRWVAGVGGVVTLLPLGVSAVTVGFGYLIVLAGVPSVVSRSPAIIPVVQALIAIPVVYRMLVPAIGLVPDELRAAAATLGAGPLRVWCTVDLPLIRRALGVATGFAFVMALGEFGATGFLTRPGTVTVPVLIGSALGKPGAANLATAMACSVLLGAVTFAVVAMVEMLRSVGEPDL